MCKLCTIDKAFRINTGRARCGSQHFHRIACCRTEARSAKLARSAEPAPLRPDDVVPSSVSSTLLRTSPRLALLTMRPPSQSARKYCRSVCPDATAAWCSIHVPDAQRMWRGSSSVGIFGLCGYAVLWPSMHRHAIHGHRQAPSTVARSLKMQRCMPVARGNACGAQCCIVRAHAPTGSSTSTREAAT